MKPATLAQRIYILERRSGIDQEGSCGLCISGGTRCGKQSGHRHRPGDERHVSALDPSFVPWGPDWEPKHHEAHDGGPDPMTIPVLEPCPFCGSRAHLGEVGRFSIVSCDGDDCGADVGTHDTDAQAIAAWNRRVSPADQRTAREVVRAAFEEAGAAVGTTLFIAVVAMLEADRASRPAASSTPGSRPDAFPSRGDVPRLR